MEQDQFCSLAGRDLASKRRARARGLSECGGMQHDAFAVAALHREMSLGSHGHDREVDRAQHLFRYGTQKQLAQLAAAPGAEKKAINLELAENGFNLPHGMSFAHQGIANDALMPRQLAPGFQG